jgi:tRNA threonylcarbamoyladenosine biosynthesis protein TsaB
MVESMLTNCGTQRNDIDLIAAARGPGSFTGIRIGIATAKGLMWGLDVPGCGVSTLEAMAWQAAAYTEDDCLICAVMDARRGQVYNALFTADNGRPVRMTEDRAVGVDKLKAELIGTHKKILLTGDGAELCRPYLISAGLKSLMLAPEYLRQQNAWGVALAAAAIENNNKQQDDIEPIYLRLSQAERERLEKES